MITRPKLANCKDRSKLPKLNPFCGDPENWFNQNVLEDKNIKALTFDFFVDWSKSPVSLTNEFWLKGIALCNLEELSSIEIIGQELDNVYGQNYVRNYVRFCLKHSIVPVALIYNDDNDWQTYNGPILFIKFALDSHYKLIGSKEVINRDDLMSRIQVNSGGPVKIGTKGLFYGTSRLECYLSKTRSLYPGDADLILIEDNDVPICVIEFKKHNLTSPITAQKLSNYYPYPDGRKYNRLEVLRNSLSDSEKSIPLIVVYYPTDPKIKYGVLEIVTGSYNNLRTLASKKFVLPNKSDEKSLSEIVSLVLRAVNYYNDKN